MNEVQLTIFKRAFLEANSGLISFPETIYEDKINEIEYYTDSMRGIRTARFFLKKNEAGNWYLDLFAGTDYQTWHKRIEHDGTIIDLENFQGETGRPVYPDDPARTTSEWDEIQANNKKVMALLLKKGLEKNPDDPEFERLHVVRLTIK
jgi:hypothetical protein